MQSLKPDLRLVMGLWHMVWMDITADMLKHSVQHVWPMCIYQPVKWQPIKNGSDIWEACTMDYIRWHKLYKITQKTLTWFLRCHTQLSMPLSVGACVRSREEAGKSTLYWLRWGSRIQSCISVCVLRGNQCLTSCCRLLYRPVQWRKDTPWTTDVILFIKPLKHINALMGIKEPTQKLQWQTRHMFKQTRHMLPNTINRSMWFLPHTLKLLSCTIPDLSHTLNLGG